MREEELGIRGRQALAQTLHAVPEDDDDLNAEEQENLEETLVDDATASKTVSELEVEIRILVGLERKAQALVASGLDRKWDELSKILQNDPAMRNAAGQQRKLIIFSEHRDTLNYLHQKIEVESAALHGRVFDILGEVFEGVSLKDLLMRAIRS